jgi:hypothetical protein
MRQEVFSKDTTGDELQERFGGRASVSVALRLLQGQQPNAEPSQRPHSRENEGVWALVGRLSSETHVRSSRRFRTTP